MNTSSARSSKPAGGLRGETRRMMQGQVAAIALDLFARQGFEQTTIEDIAGEAGLSRSSFFRYFGTKEDVALVSLETYGHRIADALSARPDAESPWTALRRAFDQFVGRPAASGQEQQLWLMIMETPSLRSRLLERQLGWQSLLAPEIARRMGVPPEQQSADIRARAIAAAALSCLDIATEAWVTGPGQVPISTLLDDAMDAIRMSDRRRDSGR
jgi:AcrR family transcriptional regulator